MAINRYDTPAQFNPINTYVPLPMEDLLKAGAYRQQKFDETASIEDMILEAATPIGLKQVRTSSGEILDVNDYYETEKLAKEFNSKINSLAEELGTTDKSDPLYRQKVRSLAHQLKQEMDSTGTFGRARANMEAYQNIQKTLQENPDYQKAPWLASSIDNELQRFAGSPNGLLESGIGIGEYVNRFETLDKLVDGLEYQFTKEFGAQNYKNILGLIATGTASAVDAQRVANVAESAIRNSDIGDDLGREYSYLLRRGVSEEDATDMINAKTNDLVNAMISKYTGSKVDISTKFMPSDYAGGSAANPLGFNIQYIEGISENMQRWGEDKYPALQNLKDKHFEPAEGLKRGWQELFRKRGNPEIYKQLDSFVQDIGLESKDGTPLTYADKFKAYTDFQKSVSDQNAFYASPATGFTKSMKEDLAENLAIRGAELILTDSSAKTRRRYQATENTPLRNPDNGVLRELGITLDDLKSGLVDGELTTNDGKYHVSILGFNTASDLAGSFDISVRDTKGSGEGTERIIRITGDANMGEQMRAPQMAMHAIRTGKSVKVPTFDGNTGNRINLVVQPSAVWNSSSGNYEYEPKVLYEDLDGNIIGEGDVRDITEWWDASAKQYAFKNVKGSDFSTFNHTRPRH